METYRMPLGVITENESLDTLQLNRLIRIMHVFSELILDTNTYCTSVDNGDIKVTATYYCGESILRKQKSLYYAEYKD